MRKDEILEKSKKENLFQDERSCYLCSTADTISYSISFLVLVIIIFWKTYNNIAHNDLVGILMLQMGTSSLIKYKNKIEGKAYLICGILFIFASIIFLIDFFVNG